MWVETERGSVVNLDNAYYVEVRKSEKSGGWAFLTMADRLYVITDGVTKGEAEAAKTFILDELKRDKREVRFDEITEAMKGAKG